jgi:hypothetical protein
LHGAHGDWACQKMQCVGGGLHACFLLQKYVCTLVQPTHGPMCNHLVVEGPDALQRRHKPPIRLPGVARSRGSPGSKAAARSAQAINRMIEKQRVQQLLHRLRSAARLSPQCRCLPACRLPRARAGLLSARTGMPTQRGEAAHLHRAWSNAPETQCHRPPMQTGHHGAALRLTPVHPGAGLPDRPGGAQRVQVCARSLLVLKQRKKLCRGKISV